MDVQQLLAGARDALTVQRVFGEPYVKNGLTVFPVAKVQGGGGGGQNEEQEGATATGGGFGLSVRPAGMYVLRGDTVHWEAALDVNKILVGMQVVAVVALLTFRSVFKARLKARRGQ
jgi:uncharacterized spore protein YtfJ